MTFDLILRGATVVDGLGGEPFAADVGLEGPRIAAVGDLGQDTGCEELDTRGLALSPGFIDVHTHDDFAALRHPDMSFKSRGGVTTCIVGNCGFGPAPYGAACEMLRALTPGAEPPVYDGHAGYAAAVEAAEPGVNIGFLAGHGTLRLAVMGQAARAPEPSELRQMQSLLREALDAGALGLSSGLIYAPGRHAAREELIALAAEMRGSGALYATHLRDEAGGLLEAVDEAIEIGERAGVGVQISHHKAAGRDNWGHVRHSLARIDAAQARGLNVHADQYPYTAGSTTLAAILDNGAFQPGSPGGVGALAAEDVLIASCPGVREWEGKTIAALSQHLGRSPLTTAQAVFEKAPDTTVVLHMMSEADVQQVMRHPSTMIGSDGIPTLNGRPHPRLYNSFARVLGHYARDLGVLDLPTAVHRMTDFPARKFGLTDRGVVRAGAWADLVLFEAEGIIDTGTYADPNRYPAGIRHVLVNGRFVMRDGVPTGARPGRLLRRSG